MAQELAPGVKRSDQAASPVSLGDGVLALAVDTTIYSRATIFRACYATTDRCYLYLAQKADSKELWIITLSARSPADDLLAAAGEFCNQLVDHELRQLIEREAGSLRELIVAQAFAEGNLLPPVFHDGNPEANSLSVDEV